MPDDQSALLVFAPFPLSYRKSYAFVKGQCQTFVSYYHSAYGRNCARSRDEFSHSGFLLEYHPIEMVYPVEAVAEPSLCR
jgi:hypothetical protein